MKTRTTLWLLLVAAILLAGTARGGPPELAEYDIPWDAVTSGGEQLSSEHYVMHSSAGQTLADWSDSSGYHVETGFWAGVTAEHKAFLPATAHNAP